MNLETDTPIQAFKGVLTYSQGEHMYSVSSEQVWTSPVICFILSRRLPLPPSLGYKLIYF